MVARQLPGKGWKGEVHLPSEVVKGGEGGGGGGCRRENVGGKGD